MTEVKDELEQEIDALERGLLGLLSPEKREEYEKQKFAHSEQREWTRVLAQETLDFFREKGNALPEDAKENVMTAAMLDVASGIFAAAILSKSNPFSAYEGFKPVLHETIERHMSELIKALGKKKDFDG